MRCLPAALALLAAALPARADEFFEKKIRPALVEHCFKCHSADAVAANKLKAGLRLDHQAGVLAGGDSGPAVVPGKPADSLLVKTLRYDGDVKMPPTGKLPDAVVADFERWVKDGAKGLPADAGGPKKQVGMSVADGKKFWAYRPVRAGDGAWSIDQFIRAKLAEKGLKPAPAADKTTLVRRLSFDLIGLPPTPEQIAAFVSDPSADAYERLVDRLLASPQFGERWGRHWLDVARYAESVTLRGFVFKQAWRYRDYVIDSFNRDVPFDRFVKEQIAGDLLPAATPADRRRQLVAATYLMLGNTNLEEQDKKQLRMDVVDEQLDAITKGFLAQTVTCARCHDHKFDPIPTRDYYALAGILRNTKAMEHANVSAWVEVPLPLAPEQEAKVKAAEAAIAAAEAKLKAAKGGGKVAAGVLAVADVPGVVVDDADAKKVGTWTHSTHSKNYVGAGYLHDDAAGKGEKTLTFAPALPADGEYEVRLAYSPGTSRSDAVPVTVFGADGEKTILVNMKAAPPLDGRFVSLGTFKFEKAGQSFVIVATEGTTGHVTADCVTFVPVGAPATTGTGGAKPAAGAAVAALDAELKKLKAAGPHRPTAMAPQEEKAIEDCRVHIRGVVSNLGEAVPRGFLSVASSGPPPAFPKTQSGRVELADWVASKDHPLTARVFVNRTWHWLFGAGLVRTVDNFGTTGERPSHPELLDAVAADFVAGGWSVKKLVRRIVLTDTYRQASAGDPATATADPDNRLFGRANRRRLDAECIRDAMLAVSGKLDPTAGGPGFADTLAADYGFKAESTRRSVYLPQFRNALPDLLEAFDAADPSAVCGVRNTSTVAPQALFLMNHPFPAEQAGHTAANLLGDKATDPERLTRLYRAALGRDPTAGERRVADGFLARPGDAADKWAAVAHALFASADFRFVD